jgi:arylformamidase
MGDPAQVVMLYDITPPISANLAVWPGDTPMTREVLMDMKAGDHLTLSTIHATVHLGAHADGPNHYAQDSDGIETANLESYLGRCRVVRVEVGRGERITPDHVPPGPDSPRILFATGTYPDPEHFNDDFAALSPELVTRLHRSGVILVGLDTPSIDPFRSRKLESHAACAACEMAILEGLVLSHVPEGEYELIALPLKLKRFDASPVRAVLRTLDSVVD